MQALDLLQPLDYPRQAVANLARGGYRLGSGEGSLSDLLGMVPGLAGAAASPFISPLGGAALAGGLHGLGKLSGLPGFDAPTTQDVVSLLGGDPESTWQNIAAQIGTDPLTYAGALKIPRLYGLGRELAAPGMAAEGLPLGGVVSDMHTINPLEVKMPGAYHPTAPGVPQSIEDIYAAIEADAAAQAAREAQAAGQAGGGVADLGEASRVPLLRRFPDQAGDLTGRTQILRDMMDDMMAGNATPTDRLQVGHLTDNIINDPLINSRASMPHTHWDLSGWGSPEGTGATTEPLQLPLFNTTELPIMRMRQALADAESGAYNLMGPQSASEGSPLMSAMGMSADQLLGGGTGNALNNMMHQTVQAAGPQRIAQLLTEARQSYPPLAQAEQLSQDVTGLINASLPPQEAAAAVRRLQASGLPIDPETVLNEYQRAWASGTPAFTELETKLGNLGSHADTQAQFDQMVSQWNPEFGPHGPMYEMPPANVRETGELLRLLGPNRLNQFSTQLQPGMLRSMIDLRAGTTLENELPAILQELANALGVR